MSEQVKIGVKKTWRMEDVNTYVCQHHRLMIIPQNTLVPVPTGTTYGQMAGSAKVRLFFHFSSTSQTYNRPQNKTLALKTSLGFKNSVLTNSRNSFENLPGTVAYQVFTALFQS